MNLLNIINEIEKVDPEFQERISPRRAAIRNMTGFGTKVALSALPLAFGSLLKKAYGQTSNADIVNVLNFALTLEFLESEFYKRGVSTANLIPAGTPAVAALTTIKDDEAKHVAFLQAAIRQLNGTPVNFTAASFDYTAKGNFPTVFSNYDVFLAVAQAFEDTGVRAYKGQAGNLMSNRGILTAALNIHSVEARHASHVRQMRQARGATNNKPWITGSDRGGLPDITQRIYAGEELATQGGVTLVGMMASGVTLSNNAVTEAFDEPLSREEVTAIVAPFFA
jgi:rubrerythrin